MLFRMSEISLYTLTTQTLNPQSGVLIEPSDSYPAREPQGTFDGVAFGADGICFWVKRNTAGNLMDVHHAYATFFLYIVELPNMLPHAATRWSVWVSLTPDSGVLRDEIYTT